MRHFPGTSSIVHALPSDFRSQAALDCASGSFNTVLASLLAPKTRRAAWRRIAVRCASCNCAGIQRRDSSKCAAGILLSSNSWILIASLLCLWPWILIVLLNCSNACEGTPSESGLAQEASSMHDACEEAVEML